MRVVKAKDYAFEDIIRIIREWTELTQEEFGKTIGKSERTVSAWECGENSMSLATFSKILKKHKIDMILSRKN